MDQNQVKTVKPVALVSLFSLLNYGLAFLTQIIVAEYYGNNLERDAYLIALTIPSYIVSIFITVLPSVYLAKIIEVRNTSIEKSWQFAKDVFVISIVGLSFVVIICSFFSSNIIRLIAPSVSTKTLSLGSSLYIILLPSIVFNIASGLLGSLYYSRYEFGIPSLATVINSLVALICVLIFNQTIGIYSLAYGFLAGSIVAFLFLFSITKNFPSSFSFRSRSIYKFLSTAAPLIFTGVVYQSVTIFQRRYASMLPVGSVSSLGYSMQMITVLSNILSGGISKVLFPLMSNAWIQKDLQMLRKYFSTGVIVILAASVPFVAFFYFLGTPFVRAVFERGAFSQQDTASVSRILFILSGALVFYSLGNIVAKGFYFSGRTFWAATQEMLVLITYLYLGYLFSARWALAGLALATTSTTGLGVALSFLFMSYISKGVNIGRIAIVLMQVAFASILSGVAAFGVYTMGGSIGDLYILILAMFLQITMYYLIVIYLFKIPELLFVQRKIVDYIREWSKYRFQITPF